MKRRRTNGEGSLFQVTKKNRDGSLRKLWAAYVLDRSKGHCKRIYRYGADREMAKRKWEKLKGDLHDGIASLGSKQTLAQFCDEWLANASKRIHYSSWRYYRGLIESRIKPSIGHLRLCAIEDSNIEDFVNGDTYATPPYIVEAERKRAARANGSRPTDSSESIQSSSGKEPTKKKKSGRLRQQCYDVVKKILDNATDKKKIRYNPARGVDRPAARRSEIVPLNQAQVEAFLEAAERDPYYTLFLLAFNSGMRQGELFGLKPRDVDYIHNRISVQRAVIATRAGYKDAPEGISATLDTLVAAPPKQGKMRTIKLPRFVVVMLRQHANELARQGQFEWLFTNKVGGLIWASDFNRSHFQKIKKAANRALPAGSKLPPSFRFHDIRHTHATLLLEDGVDTKIVSERLGHSSPAFTAATYQHILPPMQDKAADAIDRRGFGKGDRKEKRIRRKRAA